MLIIGELLNASRKAVATAIEARDTETVQKIARAQADVGADYIDVNAGVFVGREAECLAWLIETVQSATDKPCAIDSADPRAIEAGLAVHRGTPMVNSISLEKHRYENLMPVVAGTDSKIIALCMSDAGMPETVDDRLKVADELVNGLLRNNVPVGNILVDPLVQPVSVNKDFGTAFLRTLPEIRTRFEGIHTACGLSNISYGLPARKLMNRTFLAMAMAWGLDGAIVNPLDPKIMAELRAAEALLGRDDYCMDYIRAYRAGAFEGLV